MKDQQFTGGFNLEGRTEKFALNCRNYIKTLPKSITNIEYSKQLARSSGSQAANYIEANEALSKKDFSHRIKICRKETKESRLWLTLLEPNNSSEIAKKSRQVLIDEASQLIKIFSAIYQKSQESKTIQQFSPK